VSAKVMYAKYRARFFSLMTKCLVLNTMLPAHLVAAFIKRLCRCTLSGPPSGALFVLALVSNLLKKHPECSCLVQRKAGITEMEDCFLADEDDPVECRALQSSLWELAVFERHYYSAVSTLAKSIGRAEEDKAPLYNVEEFAAHTYGSLFDQEKKKKNKTALTFKKPTSLFTEDDIFSGCIQIGDH
jgi:U3 small nucleolar RNA-associated protein 19